MQLALRPYATAGIALVGASMIAVTPVVVPPPSVQTRPFQLVDAWSDLVATTTANIDSIISNASSSDISQVFSELLTNPLGVIGALANFDPTVTTDLTSLPATITVDLPPALELAIAGLGATGTTAIAVENLVQQLQTDPSALYEGIATVLNAYLNGQDNISLLDGAITIPLLNGVLAPQTSLDVNINLTSLIDALGLGNTPLSDLDLSALLSQLGLGDLTLGSLFSDLGLSGKGLGDLLGDPSLGTLLGDLGLGNLGLGSFGLTTLLTDLGLNSDLGHVTLTQLLNALNLNQDLGSFGLTTLLGDLGLNSDLGSVSLTQVLNALGLNPDLGSIGLNTLIGDLFPGLDVGSVNLGTLLGDLGLLNPIVSGLNTTLSALLGPVGTLLDPILATISPTLNITNLVSLTGLENVVNGLTLGNGGALSLESLLTDLGIGSNTTALGSISELLGTLGITVPSTGDLSLSGLITDVLTELGKAVPSTGDLSILSLLTDLGVPISPTGDLTIASLLTDVLHELNVNIPSTGDIDLSTLLGDLNLDGLSVGSLLNTVDLGTLLNDLGLSNLPLDLSNLGDISNLTLGDLIGDLGLGDLANVSVEPLGGFYTLLADVVPQQVLASLGI